MRALSEELENPLNVHRWRQLEGSVKRFRVYSENPTATKTIGTKERRGDEIGERVGR